MEHLLQNILIEIINMNLTASVIIIAILLVRCFLKRAPRIYTYALWGIVLFRLLCPFSFESEVSLLGVLQNEPSVEGRMEYIPQDIGYQMEPEVHMPVDAAEDMVNHSLPSGNEQGSVNPLQVWLYVAVRIWMLGMLGMIIYSAISLWKLKKQLKIAVWERENIYRIADSHSPFVYGIFSPCIYIPESIEAAEINYVLLHEQIHIKRGDHVYRMLAYLALCIHWFNPLVWIAFSISGRDMEISCDESVIQKMGSSVKKEYSASLLNLACGDKIVKGIPLAFGESDTGSRIKHVLKYKKPTRLIGVTAAIACVVIALILIANPVEEELQKEPYSVYGIITYQEPLKDSEIVVPQMRLRVNIPGRGESFLPNTEVRIPYDGKEFTGLEEGDLVEIVYDSETVKKGAKSIEVKGKGFALEKLNEDTYSFAIPKGIVSAAGIGDTVEIYLHTANMKEAEVIAVTEVLDIDKEKMQAWVEVSQKQAERFLSNYGSGIYCHVIPQENSYEGVSLEGKDSMNTTDPEDGVYHVSVRSIAKSARCIDRYVVDFPSEFETEQTELYFAENCDFFINEEMTSVRYKEVSFDEFVDCVMWDEDGGNASCNLTFQNGLITKAEMINPLGKYGISYQAGTSDTWYPHIMEMIREEEGVNALETYFTLDEVIPVELSEFEEGEETIEIYTGNIGDGDSGIVLFKNSQGEVLGSETAHHARVGWNNIYLVEDNGKAYILTVYIEDRDDYGGYGYQVYEIGPAGMLMQRAGTIFEWGGLVYDDSLFKEWVSGMEYYLRRSYLLLSSQEGEIRTEHISEADKYNYETLKRE